jgi:hypothetical protein
MTAWTLRKPFVLATYGTSLTTGRLSTFWSERLREQLNAVPEAVGRVCVQNMGKGSQNSDWGLANAGFIADLNPSHILTEGFAINDSAVTGGIPQVSRAQHLTNMQGMHDLWKARNPEVQIIWQTMNGVSTAGAGLRPDLADYYADEIAKAAAMGDFSLDNFSGPPIPPGQPGGWIKPLPAFLTNEGDGLHPIWAGAVEIYLFPNVLFRIRQAMATWWGLPDPVPPEPPAAVLLNYELVPAGGGGGGGPGGGGGAAGDARQTSRLSIDELLTIRVGLPGAGGLNVVGSVGADGGLSAILPLDEAAGGKGGGPALPNPDGAGLDGVNASGAGAGLGGNLGGVSVDGLGHGGGDASDTAAGGGAGRAGDGEDAALGIPGQGGPGVATVVPGETGDLAAGAPGGSNSATPVPAYLPGAGPSSRGGGGRGGGDGTGVPTAGEDGGEGRVTIWYAGPAIATGGVITSFGGYTIHTFTEDGYWLRTFPGRYGELDFSNFLNSSLAGGR